MWKLSVLSVALAGMAVNLPIPVPDINRLDDYFTTVSDLCKEAVGRETETAQLLNDLEVLYKGVFEGRATDAKLDENRISQIQHSVGESYKAVAKKALKPKNLKTWEPYMQPAITHSDSGDQVMWVRKQSHSIV